MEALIGITANDRYFLESLVSRSGLVVLYSAIDRGDNSRKMVEIWDLELADQDDFLARLHELSQVEDRRLLPIVDGGILVVPSGADILKEVPYIVTEVAPDSLEGEELSLSQVLTIGVKVASILQRLHSGAHVRSRSGQIIGQVRLSHGNLNAQSICLDRVSNKVILRDWYRFGLLEKQYLPQEDVKDLQTTLTALLKEPPRKVVEILAGEYGNAQSLGEKLRQWQMKRPQRPWALILAGLTLPIGVLLYFFRPQEPVPEPVVVEPAPSPIEVIRPEPRPEVVPSPRPPREPQVFRVDFPTAPPVVVPPPAPPPPPPPPPTIVFLPPIVRPPAPPPSIMRPPVFPLVPPSNDPQAFRAIETTIDGNFAPTYRALVDQMEERAIATIAGEFENPSRQEVSMLVLATRRGRTAPIFAARVERSVWEQDPEGTTWANFMPRSSSLLGFGVSTVANPFGITIDRSPRPLVPSIQPLRSSPVPTPEEIEQEIQDRR